jgi:nucleotide-binding universal stress UspA family protein
MYQHIMVPLDGSELAECVFPHLEVVARGCNVEKVTLVRVVEPLHLRGGVETHIPPEERQRLDAAAIKVAKSYLDQIVERLKQGGLDVESGVLYGRVVDELADYADKNEVDLIIISTHGHSGISRWVWGNTADRILRAVCAPVFMVRAPGCVPGI